ncbi:MAG: hypothetical protein PHY48_15250 [Candidatus Cloacimonetes bacterium]|nr:hypothetical protein [Candidatus Cloacimonadota bacterium]
MIIQQPSLSDRTTRSLLMMLGYARACGGMYIDHRGNTYRIEQIKAELALREHIQNKQEARITRQNKAKQRSGRNNGKRKQNR